MTVYAAVVKASANALEVVVYAFMTVLEIAVRGCSSAWRIAVSLLKEDGGQELNQSKKERNKSNYRERKMKNWRGLG